MYRLILFDIDGVILSEERYFDASSLTVWELLYSSRFLGLPGETFTPLPEEKTTRAVRQTVFADDEILNFIKSRGINSNWDMVFLVFSHHLILLWEKLLPHLGREKMQDWFEHPIDRTALSQLGNWAKGLVSHHPPRNSFFIGDFAKSGVQKAEMLLYLNRIAKERLGVETGLFSRNSALWKLCQETFQEWYLGTEGKKGFLKDEVPVVEPGAMRKLLLQLKGKGISLGIGTGRPATETHVPLQELDLLHLFDPDRIVTASHVLQAERQFPEKAPLAKPHPYTYLKGILGLEADDAQVLETELPLRNGDEILIVGDSLADLYAARTIGCRFAAVLTGLKGKAARQQFVERRADYILDDATELITRFA